MEAREMFMAVSAGADGLREVEARGKGCNPVGFKGAKLCIGTEITDVKVKYVLDTCRVGGEVEALDVDIPAVKLHNRM